MKKTILIIIGAVLLAGVALVGSRYVLAEQSGSSPESGATSYLKATYDSLVSLAYGVESAGSWGDWGAKWNRIRSAGEWTPSGNSDISDVRTSKTFYSNSRTQQIGGLSLSGAAFAPCPTQQYHDSYGSPPVTQTTNCTVDNSWTDPGDGISGTDLRDNNTTLIWSYPLYNNGGVIEFSSSFATPFSWNNSHANNLGRTAAQLCSDRGNGWRLPSQKELMQAYIDGSFFNLNQPSSYFWSVSLSSSSHAWYVALNGGYASNYSMGNTYQVRCVR